VVHEPNDQDAERSARARARQDWPGRKTTLTQADRERPLGAEDAIAAMWELCMEAWLLSGRPLPEYDRGGAPGRIWRDGARPPEHAR
jgi:hypothetical protein